MNRTASLLYGGLVYVLFLAVFAYAVAFVGGFAVPKTLDTGPSASTATALLVDLGLLMLFAVQHSVMARSWFKERWTRIVPPHLERSTFVLAATATLAFLMWAWQPIPATVWSVGGTGAAVLWGVFAVGWVVVLASTFLIDHGNLFGLRQVWLHFRGREYTHPEFQTPALYRYVRHPLYLGFLMAFWAVPEMTVGHLVFAVGTTGYILVGIWFEERDLVRYHGDAYARYRKSVPMLLPLRRADWAEAEVGGGGPAGRPGRGGGAGPAP